MLGTPAYFDRAGTPSTPANSASTRPSSICKEKAACGRSGAKAPNWPLSVQSRLQVTAAEGVRAAVLAHAGLTIASEWMFTPELRSGAVRAVLSEWSLPPLDLWAVFPTGRAATAKARAFVDFFERSIQRVTANAVAATPFRARSMRRTSMSSIPPGIQRLGADEYGDTQRSCSSRASCKGVSPCPAPDPEALISASVAVASLPPCFHRQMPLSARSVAVFPDGRSAPSDKSAPVVSDLALALACSGRPSATAPGRCPPARSPSRHGSASNRS